MLLRDGLLPYAETVVGSQRLCRSARQSGIFALLGNFNYTVVLGGLIGGILAIGNFFFMAIASNSAADKAADQNVKEGKAMVKGSYFGRLFVIGVLLFIFAKSGHCNVLAMACPLFFVFPIISVIEFFRKSGEHKS